MRSQVLLRVFLAGLAGVAVANVTVADPPADVPRVCEARGQQEAGALADKLFAAAEYQHAGACYQAAGDLPHANLAYLKAAGPRGADTAESLKAQGDAARALFASVGHAFHKNH